ncbi:hypothetical protein NWF34_14485 [Gordonia sp. GONU]|uniref:hypothetical protein n=1 Tax=Gordonia sp. GONU TaxID=2972949 RepID=UPI0021ABE270|nr:hypothetical protein [Gordonia sp. GONU]MCR8898153.1 hypothetical protein [Gordonia sp. GONU]
MEILPRTKLGKWSSALLAAYFLIFIFTNLVIVGLFHQEGGETFTDNLYVSIPMLSVFVLAVAALVTGGLSVFRYKERALLVYASIALGLTITIFMIGELIAPH